MFHKSLQHKFNAACNSCYVLLSSLVDGWLCLKLTDSLIRDHPSLCFDAKKMYRRFKTSDVNEANP